ncbi:MAG: hypothetical protein HKN04_13700 [Rhodothermaceae bacterium]|nr:hypothetical protein [Rhodothermaceae bacterium]
MPAHPSLAYRVLVSGVRFVLRIFFREIAVEGREHIPTDRGGLLVAWHPNGLIDPALILAHFPGRLVFGARDGLFRWPVIGWIMKQVGTVPIYRASDQKTMSEDERDRANKQSLAALAGEIAQGSFSALFPEGQSHDQPYLSELKSGAARLYYQARASAEATPVIIPVGLHYDRKDVFRSDVLIVFHDPMTLPADLDIEPNPQEDDTAARARTHRLTDEIERTLGQVVHSTEDWQLHALMHRARTLLRAEAAERADEDLAPESITERQLGFAQIWHGYQVRHASHPEEIASLRHDLTRYHRLLRALGLEDADLDRDPHLSRPLSVTLLVLRAFLIYVLLPPVLLLGYVINGPVHLLIRWLAKRYSGAIKDTATVKILTGFVLYPLTWTLWGLGAALVHAQLHTAFPTLPDTPFLTGLVVVMLGFLSGVLVLNYAQLAAATGRALRVRLTRQKRKDQIADLCAKRSALHDRFLALREGLALPDEVTDLSPSAGT